MNGSTLTTTQISLIIIMAIWTIIWKGIALWYAAGKKDKVWFIVLLLLNTAGILDMVYIFIFSKRGNTKSAE
jgi:hypothetical protein